MILQLPVMLEENSTDQLMPKGNSYPPLANFFSISL